jgi:hypothetical protein
MRTQEFEGVVVQYLGGSRDVLRDFVRYRRAAGRPRRSTDNGRATPPQ